MAGSVLQDKFSSGTSWADDANRHAADLTACKALLRDGSKTFLAASMLLPASVRDPACALYAFCRLADDVVDAPGASTRRPIEMLRRRLTAMYAGEPVQSPADRALAAVVHEFAIPRGMLDALLEGFEWDHAGRRYQTLDELLAYAARVAGTVGAMMSLIMGARSPAAIASACELGCAMQLSNIARDVGEDARLGRIYLPTDWLEEAGIDVDAWLVNPVFTPALAQVTERLLKAADALYARVDAGVALLPVACRPGINAARFLYAEIGQQVRRNALNSVDRRAVVRRRRKLQVLLRSVSQLRYAESAPAEPTPAIDFLVRMPDARSSVTRARSQRPPSSSRTVRIIDLFEQLEHRRHDRREAGVYR